MTDSEQKNNTSLKEESTKKNEIKTSSKQKRKIFPKIIFYCCIFLLLLIALASLTQTALFKNFLKDYVVNQLNENFQEKNSFLTVGSLEGNLFSEIIIKDAKLKVQNDDMIKLKSIHIKYDVFTLIDKKVNIQDVEIFEPEINFVKVLDAKKDSVWNFIYLFSKEEKEEVEEKEFDWKIKVDHLRISNLNFVMLGSKPFNVPVSVLKIDSVTSLNTEYLKVSSLNLETDVYIDNNSKQFKISHLNLKSNFGFDLLGLSGEFYISKSRAEVNKLNIETKKSWVQMEYVFIDKLDLLSGIDLKDFKNKDLRLSLSARQFNFDDLKCFLPQVDFLNGIVSLNLIASGKFDNVKIDKLYLKTNKSTFNFTGRMFNLDEPANLSFDVHGDNLVLYPEDTKTHLPGLPIPDYSYLGIVTGNISYRGEPLNFQSEIDVQSGNGDVKGTFSLNLNHQPYTYKTTFETRNLNLGKIFRDEELYSNINSKFDITGSGFELANLSAKVIYDISNTKIFDLNIDKSAGVVDIHNYNLKLEIGYSSGSLKAAVKGDANISDFSNPKYSLEGEIQSLDISDFTKDTEDKSNLNFRFAAHGSGSTFDNISGKFTFILQNSFYSDYFLPATPVAVILTNTGESRLISLTSDIFDFRAEGKFQPKQLSEVIFSNVKHITEELSEKLELDTIIPQQFTGYNKSDMNFSYNLITKDTAAVNRIFSHSGFKFSGNISGDIQNSANTFKTTSRFSINKLGFIDTSIRVTKITGSLSYENDYSKYIAEDNGNLVPLNIVTNIYTDKIEYRGSSLDKVGVKIKLSDEIQSFTVFGKQDTSLSFDVSGRIDYTKDNLVGLDINKVDVKYSNIGIQNDGSISIIYDNNVDKRDISFEKFFLKSNLLKLQIEGKINLSGYSNLTFECKDVSIPELLYTLTEEDKSLYSFEEWHESNPIFGNIRRVTAVYKGTMDDPEVNIEMNSGVIRYFKTKIGRIDAFIDFKNDMLTNDILVSNSLGKGSLRLKGTLPLANPLISHDDVYIKTIQEEPLDLTLTAKNFQLNFFSKLIPNLAEVRGLLNGEMSSTGNINEPILNGNFDVTSGRFYFDMNDMYFRYYSNLHAENSKIMIDQFKVFNIENDLRFINIWGSIDLSGYGFKYVDLYSSGDLVVLERDSRQTSFGFYGDMVAGIGSPQITLKGTPDDLLLSGQLVVKSADLIFPTIQGFSYDIYADNFVYKIIKDTSHLVFLDTTIVTTPDRISSIDPFLGYRYILSKKPSSVIDIITFDLDVVTEKNVYVLINFNDLTREELFGELKGNITIDNKTNHQFMFYGVVDIVGDSYYRFYKNFKVNNSQLIFEGPPDNPRLNIHAIYQNRRTINDFGTTETEVVDVILDITGTRNKPELNLKLKYSDGTELTGTDAQSNAISYLLFGVPITSLGANVRNDLLKNIGSSTGSAVLSSLLLSAIREVAPFILNTEIIYSEGSVTQGTDIRITSAVGDAIVKFGGKILSNINNAEVNIEYPLNKLLGLDISNNLILEISRSVDDNSISGSRSVTTGLRLSYKINY